MMRLMNEPSKDIKECRDPHTGRRFIGCGLCGLELGPYPEGEACGMDSLMGIAHNYLQHVEEAHPEVAAQIKARASLLN